MEQRVIKFRGKCATSNEWVYGDLIHGVGLKKGNLYILPDAINLAKIKHCDPLDGVRVIPETVGQFTGITDKNGKEIYHFCKFDGEEYGEYYLVEWNNKEAMFEVNLYGYAISTGEGSQEVYDTEISKVDTNCFEISCLTEMEITGTIHDK